MNTTSHIYGYAFYENLPRELYPTLAGALINRQSVYEPLPPDKLAEIINETDIPLNIIPDYPVIKMAREEHVTSFFQDGTLQLGTFEYFNRFDHEEIGDVDEGIFLLIGEQPNITAFALMGGGFNFYVFCAYGGVADNDCISRFNYDSSFEIVDIDGFCEAIKKEIGAISYKYSRCLYSKDKAILGKVPRGFNFSKISSRLLELVQEAKYFVKPKVYSHQSEFRIVWQMPNDVEMPFIGKFPDAIQFCRR